MVVAFFKALIRLATQVRVRSLTCFCIKNLSIECLKIFYCFFKFYFFNIRLILNWSLFFYHIIKIKKNIIELI
jgi:hypothetical protein